MTKHGDRFKCSAYAPNCVINGILSNDSVFLK